MKEEIIKKYLNNEPIFKICREFKIGKKTLRKIIIENNMPVRTPIKGAIMSYPYTKNQIIDKIEILSDNWVHDGERWCINFRCSCGKESLKKRDVFERMKFKCCENCGRKFKYPEKRKTRTDIFNSNGIGYTWITNITLNNIRGFINQRVIEVSITTDDLYKQLLKQNFRCALTNIKLDILWYIKAESNASIDRIDSNKGYTPDNIQWVIKEVNRMKNSFSQDYFIKICKLVSQKYDNSDPSLENDIIVSKKEQRLESEESNQYSFQECATTQVVDDIV